MKKKLTGRLSLNKETIRELDGGRLKEYRGGAATQIVVETACLTLSGCSPSLSAFGNTCLCATHMNTCIGCPPCW